MSVLIKGMEMPKTCYDCIFYGGLECSLTGFDADRKSRHCPLVELPPHGRLIDGDILQGQIKKRKNFVGRVSDADCLVADAPTIIPADEEDGDG